MLKNLQSGIFGKKDQTNPPSRPQKDTKNQQRQESKKDSVLVSARGSEAGEETARRAQLAIMKNIEASKPSVIAGLSAAASPLEEAAVIFASGNAKAAIDLLIRHLNETKGRAEKRVWYLLLDAYQVTDQQAPFEKLAIFFANRFEASPPSWVVPNNEKKSEKQMAGRNALTVDGSLAVLKKEKVRDFLVAAKEIASCRVDLSRAKLLQEDQNTLKGVAHLLEILTVVRQKKYTPTLMGDVQFIEILKEWIKRTSKAPNSVDQVVWLLLFEILQWRGEEGYFDAFALEYATLFELSPPGYDETQVIGSGGSYRGHRESGAKYEEKIKDVKTLTPAEVLDQKNIDHLLVEMASQMKISGSIILDFKDVRRVDFYAATAMANFIGAEKFDKNKVCIQNAIEPIVVLFESTGGSELITFTPRKR